MCNLIEYSSNYSETTGSLWFIQKMKQLIFNQILKTLMILNLSRIRLITVNKGNTIAGGADATLKKSNNVVLLKYLSNFWRSFEMPLVNCKLELKLKWTKCGVLSAAGNKNEINNNANAENIIFTFKDEKLYVPAVTLSARDIQKLLKLLSKGFEGSVHWNEYKTKSENKNTTNEFRYFLKSNFVGVNKLFVLVYLNEDAASKRFKAEIYYLPK